MRTLIYDVERSTMRVELEIYDLKNRIKYFDHKKVTRDWVMYGAAWKWEGEKKVHCVSVKPDDPFDDSGVIKALHDAMSKADRLIGHNSDKFDYKVFNTRAIMQGLPPIHPQQYIDTIKIARKYFAFSSNSLSYIASRLGVSAKDESPDWDKIRCGCPKELRYMRKYNKQDVVVTEQVYDALKAYHHTHPKTHKIVRDIKGDKITACPKCCGTNYKVSKHRITNAGIKKVQYLCKDGCGYWTERVIA